MALLLPKNVLIKNRRLQVFYYFLMFVMLLFNLVRFGLNKSWTITVPVESSMILRVDLETSRSRVLSSDSGCNATNKDMIFNATKFIDSQFKRSTAECNPVCESLSFSVYSDTDCVEMLDVIKQKTNTAVTLNRLRKEYTMEKDAAPYVDVFFTPWVRHAVLLLQYTYKLEAPAPWFFGDQAVQGSAASTSVLLDKFGRVWKIFEAGEAITVTASMLFTDLTSATLNFGSEISAAASCYNDDFDLLQEFTMDGVFGIHASSERPVCLVQFKCEFDEHTEMPGNGWKYEDVDSMEQGDYWGVWETDLVLIQSVKGRGFMRFIDMTQMASLLSVLIVFMSFPKIVVYHIIKWCLGTVGQIYMRTLEETERILDDIEGEAVKSISQAALFKYMCGPDRPGMSQADFISRLRECYSDSAVLGENEKEQLACHAFASVCKAAMKDSGSDSDIKPMITLTDFCQSGLSGEHIGIKLTAQLFDQDRPMSFLERVFMPGEIFKALHAEAMDPTGRPLHIGESPASAIRLSIETSDNAKPGEPGVQDGGILEEHGYSAGGGTSADMSPAMAAAASAEEGLLGQRLCVMEATIREMQAKIEDLLFKVSNERLADSAETRSSSTNLEVLQTELRAQQKASEQFATRFHALTGKVDALKIAADSLRVVVDDSWRAALADFEHNMQEQLRVSKEATQMLANKLDSKLEALDLSFKHTEASTSQASSTCEAKLDTLFLTTLVSRDDVPVSSGPEDSIAFRKQRAFCKDKT